MEMQNHAAIAAQTPCRQAQNDVHNTPRLIGEILCEYLTTDPAPLAKAYRAHHHRKGQVLLTPKQSQRLRRALWELEQHYCIRGQHNQPMALLQVRDDYYFIERTLIELGFLRGDKNRTAHHAFLLLMDDLQFHWRLGRPDSHMLSRAVRCITAQTFPWVAADTTDGRLYADDLPRRRAIYMVLRKLLHDR